MEEGRKERIFPTSDYMASYMKSLVSDSELIFLHISTVRCAVGLTLFIRSAGHMSLFLVSTAGSEL